MHLKTRTSGSADCPPHEQRRCLPRVSSSTGSVPAHHSSLRRPGYFTAVASGLMVSAHSLPHISMTSVRLFKKQAEVVASLS